MKLGTASTAILARGKEVFDREAQRGDEELGRGKDFSPLSYKERKAVPSVCWQCVAQDPIIGYIEDGRLIHIEGNPRTASSGGRVCARGHAGINQVYNPDRLLHPMKRAGKRGDGQWQQISWDEALDLIVNGGEIAGRTVPGLKSLRDAGTPEKFMFHYGRMVGTDAVIIMGYFLRAYGTATIGDHNSICMSPYSIAQMLTGSRPGMWDMEEAKLILNFGAGIMEATTNHLSTAQSCAQALARGAKMYTFDVRLSNTAAKSTEWIPVKPGTDLAVVLALCHVLLKSGLYDEESIQEYTNVTVGELKDHLTAYTPEWAEKISGVPSQKIRAIAQEFGTIKPNACLSFRGVYMHYNGVQAQRAIFMLDAIANHESTGAFRGPGPRWAYPFPGPRTRQKGLRILTGERGAYAYTAAKVSHQILHMIDKGPERPDIYMVYCHNPVYSNGDCRENERIFKDEEKIPFLIAVDVGLSETSVLADLILPDATYLERWALTGKTSPKDKPEYYLRQPMHPPLGEARNFCDVACDIALRLGINLGFSSAEEFVRRTCDNTPGVKEAGGFDYMKENGVWVDENAKSVFSRRTKMKIKNPSLATKGFSAMPDWMRDPEHEKMGKEGLILTTYKNSVQTHSRTQNCKWLTEIFHENPAWINPKAASVRGIKDGDKIRIKSTIGEIVTRAFVTEGIHPSAVAVAHHCGHWAHGIYASGQKNQNHAVESDCELKWWKGRGVHPNLIIPNKGDPISGSMCWNDTVVRVEKA